MITIKINEEQIHEITDFDLKVLSYKVNLKDLQNNLKERIKWDVQNFCQEAREELKKKWMPILFKRLEFIPTDEKKILDLIFSQPDYKDAYSEEMGKRSQSELSFSIN